MSSDFEMIGGDQIITTPWGLVEFVPTSFHIDSSLSSFEVCDQNGDVIETMVDRHARETINMEGVITRKDIDARRIKRLSEYSVIELMHEVNERIKTGENAKERRKKK